MRTHTALGIAIAVIASTPLSCQGLSPEVLPADTQFVAHFDLQKCAAVLGEDLIQSQLLRQGGGKLRMVLDRAEQKFGFDPMRDLTGITVFGNSFSGGRKPSVMLWTSDRIDGMLEKLEDAGVIDFERRGGVRLGRVSVGALARELGIGEGEDSNDEGWMYIHRVGSRRALLFGENADDIVDQARVMAGAAPSLANKNDAVISGDVAKDAIVFLEVAGPLEGLIPSGPASQVADRARGLQMALWEDDGELEANAVVDLSSSEEAKNMAAVVNGLSGLAALTAGESGGPPKIVKGILESIECKAEGSQISLRAYVPTKELLNEVMKQSGMGRRSRRR